MCLGGHLAYRCALDPRVSAGVCYFATDMHSKTLGEGKNDDSLARAKEIKGELVMIFGKLDNHVPPAGRTEIRRTLEEAGVCFSFYEVAWAQRKYPFPIFSCAGLFLRVYLFNVKCVTVADTVMLRQMPLFGMSSARGDMTLQLQAYASRCYSSYSAVL
jgi:hypothetical protein